MDLKAGLTSLVLFHLLANVFSVLNPIVDPCSDDSVSHHRPQSLRSDQITVIINGYHESRIALLQSIAASYSASSIVYSVLVLWGNPSTSSETLDQLAQNLTLSSSLGAGTMSLLRQSSSSLNARFLPRSSIVTRAVLICDDDVEIDPDSFVFAFRVWETNPDRLIGFFTRSHDIDLSRKEWIYTVHPDRYSIVLTKFLILKMDYLYEYSCGGGKPMAEMRSIVDRERNCEDILMNFVVAERTNAGPILVGSQRARDWGDPRNDEGGGRGKQKQMQRKVSEVGLSNRKGEHRKRRGECIRDFHKVFGKMPLRYSYGKVVNSVAEQGLCRKKGKLVFCDQF